MSGIVIPEVRALLFDVDGTLCDSSALHYQAWSAVASQAGITVPPWQAYVEECLRGQRRFEDLLDLRLVAVSARSALYETKSRIFRQMASVSLKPLAGVENLWTRARTLGLHLAVVSTARRQSVADVIDMLRLPKPDVMVAREDVEPDVKPHPAGYRLAAEKLRLDPAHCVVFEDSPSGIEAAVTAGTRCLAMASPIFGASEQSRALIRVDTLGDVDLQLLGLGVARLYARGVIWQSDIPSSVEPARK